LANLLVIWIFAAFWESAYTKIWLFALPAVFLSISLTMPERHDLRLRRSVPLGVLVTVSAIGGVSRATSDRPEMLAALDLSRTVDREDLLIGPGWDEPTVYLRTLIRPDQRFFSLTDQTLACRLVPSCTSGALQQAILDAERDGRRTWVFGLVDLTPTEWAPFYGSKLRLPINLLAPLRQRSTLRLDVPGSSSHLTLIDAR
jgi:hypothetical protein